MSPKFMRLGTAFSVLLAIFLTGCVGDDPADCWKSATCKPVAAAPAVEPEPEPEPDAAPTCDADADPKDNLTCIKNEEIAAFVSSTTGSDSNPGTMAAPFKTISSALTSKKPRIYVCSGTYYERLYVQRTARVFGGFRCDDWEFTGEHAKIVALPKSAAVSLNLLAPQRALLSDLDLVAADSVPVEILGSAETILFRRVLLTHNTVGKTFP